MKRVADRSRPTEAEDLLVSIITPSYNRVDFLRTCIESVIAQEHPRVEHIVVDGGSTDGTVELLREYERSHGIRWISEPDEGMYHAINKGISMANGAIIGYLNTDDAYLPWSVGTVVSALISGADAVFGDMLVVKSVGGRDVSYVQYYPPFDMRHYTWLQSIGQPTVFWWADTAREVGRFDTSYGLIADCEYWLRIGSKASAPVKLPEVLAIQVDHEDTLRERRAEQLRSEFARLREQYSQYSKAPAMRPLRRAMSSLRWRWLNLAMLVSYASRGRVGGWNRFVVYLRQHGIDMYPSYALLGLLPGALRFGHGISMLDGVRVLDSLRASEADRA